MTASPPPAAGRRRWSARGAGRWLAPLLTLLVGGVALAGVDPDRSGAYGLVDALPPLVFVALGLLAASFLAALRAAPERSWLLAAHVVVLVLLLHGMAPLAEGEARLGSTWVHAGFVAQIASTGEVLRHTDARFSWPGFFAAVAALLRPAGLDSARPLLLWAPVVFELLFLGPLLLITRALAPSARVRWFAVWVFFLTNWVGQDYFSPQAVNFFLYLVALALVVTYFRPVDGGGRWSNGIGRRLAPEHGVVAVTPPQAAALLGVVVVVGLAMVVSHQLTPVALVASLAVLALCGRLTQRGLPLLFGVAVAVYVSFLAADYWTDHFAELIGVSGGDALAQNVGDRLPATPPGCGSSGSVWRSPG